MTQAIQIKLLIAILVVLLVIASLLKHGGPSVTQQVNAPEAGPVMKPVPPKKPFVVKPIDPNYRMP
jgi:hypothetical protein